MKRIALYFSTAALVFFSTNAKALDYDADVPADIKKQMVEDLAFITTVQGTQTSPLHQTIFGKMAGATYKQWFDSRVLSVGMSDCGSQFAVACVSPFFDNTKIWLTQNFIKFSHPQIARLMVVLHEARHTENQNGNWGHATCPVPFKDAKGNDMKSIWTGSTLAGQPACDVTPKGSYGSSTILLKNVSRFCESCTDKVKLDAGIYADDQLGRISSAKAKQDMIADVF